MTSVKPPPRTSRYDSPRSLFFSEEYTSGPSHVAPQKYIGPPGLVGTYPAMGSEMERLFGLNYLLFPVACALLDAESEYYCCDHARLRIFAKAVGQLKELSGGEPNVGQWSHLVESVSGAERTLRQLCSAFLHMDNTMTYDIHRLGVDRITAVNVRKLYFPNEEDKQVAILYCDIVALSRPNEYPFAVTPWPQLPHEGSHSPTCFTRVSSDSNSTTTTKE